MSARAAILTAATAAVLALGAAPAAAHTVSGAGATNFRTTLDSLTPAVPGLRLAVVENGSRLLLVNDTETPVVVLGYDGEPFLRVGPDGVFENERSPATYLDRTRGGTGPIPASADSAATPRWRRVSAGRAARWHDHRTHWMGSADPPQVAAAPGRFHRVLDWTLGFRQGERRLVAKGRLDWVPGPSPLPWLALSAALGLAAVAAAVPRRTWGVGLATATAGLVAVDVAHSAGVALARAGGPGERWGAFLAGNAVQLAVWAGGLAAAALLARRRIGALWAAGIVGVCLALADGLADAAVLGRSSAPFGWPLWLARATTAATVGLGLGLLGAAALALRRHDPLPRHAGGPDR